MGYRQTTTTKAATRTTAEAVAVAATTTTTTTTTYHTDQFGLSQQVNIRIISPTYLPSWSTSWFALFSLFKECFILTKYYCTLLFYRRRLDACYHGNIFQYFPVFHCNVSPVSINMNDIPLADVSINIWLLSGYNSGCHTNRFIGIT